MTKSNGEIKRGNIIKLLALKEQDLIAQKAAVWNFLDSEHTVKETKAFQTAIRQSDIQLGYILNSLLDGKILTSQFEHEALNLCQQCRELGFYTRDMHKALSDDLKELYRQEDKQNVDIIKNVTFFFAIPATLFTAVKNGFGGDYITAPQAAKAGIAVSTSILLRKKLTSAFLSLGKSVCETPRQIKESFLIYYAKEVTREKTNKLCTQVIRACLAQNLNKPTP